MSQRPIYWIGGTSLVAGVTQDSKEAVKWFRQAADQGNADAQCSLGLMYKNEGEVNTPPVLFYSFNGLGGYI